MAPGEPRPAREGLSLTTLVVAALASVTAAVITSTFWRGGTIVTAAVTPVIVAIAKEIFARPIESDIVRRPVERIRPALTGARDSTARTAASQPAGQAGADTARDRALGSVPIRTYGGAPRRNLHVRLALITGAVAFAIAAVVLTVPELIFGGAVAGSGSTTLGGGGNSAANSRNDRTRAPGSSPARSGKADRQQRTAPTASPQTAPPMRTQTVPPTQQPRTSPSPTQSTPAPRSQQPPAQSPATPGAPAAPQPPVQGTPSPGH